jgi:hypothetical protein
VAVPAVVQGSTDRVVALHEDIAHVVAMAAAVATAVVVIFSARAPGTAWRGLDAPAVERRPTPRMAWRHVSLH